MDFHICDNNRKLIDRLESIVRSGRVSHAYIFEGPSTIDKVDFAKCFIKGILCPDNLGSNCGKCNICDKIDHNNHEDITYLAKDGTSLKDSAVAEVQDKMNVKPLGERNIVVINDCDTMTARAQNRLLKTLEEPPGNSVMILLSENMENLLQTILSRCVKYRIDADDESAHAENADRLVNMAFEGKPFYSLVKEAGDCLKNRAKAEILLDSMEQIYRTKLTEKHKGVSLIKSEDIYRNINEIENTRKLISQGMSPAYSLKNFFLKITD